MYLDVDVALEKMCQVVSQESVNKSPLDFDLMSACRGVLTNLERDVITLRYYRGVTRSKEIAIILNSTVNSVDGAHRNGLLKLRGYVKTNNLL